MSSGANTEEGFTLLEMVCIIAIIAMMAAVLLPNIPHNTSRPRLEAYAVETASLLKADRTAAIRHRTQVATQIDGGARALRSAIDLRRNLGAVSDCRGPIRFEQRGRLDRIGFEPRARRIVRNIRQ